MAAAATYAATSQPSLLSKTPPCPPYLLPTPWPSWRRRAGGWRRSPPRQPSKGEETLATISNGLNRICRLPATAFPADFPVSPAGVHCPLSSQRGATSCLSRERAPSRHLKPPPPPPASSPPARASYQKSTMPLASRPPCPLLLSAPLPPPLSYSLQLAVYLHPFLILDTCTPHCSGRQMSQNQQTHAKPHSQSL